SGVDVDQDGKVAITLTSMYNQYGGYFFIPDLAYQPDDQGGMDMIRVNISYISSEVLAHELQHLINYAVVGFNSKTWLNETFSCSAPEVCGLDGTSIVNSRLASLESYIKETGQSLPFILSKGFVPRVGIVSRVIYVQWYLFGRYLSAQSNSVAGWDGIYRRILDAGSCTRESLEEMLRDVGVIKVGGETQSFDAFVSHYNVAIFLQEKTGIYSFEGVNIGSFIYPFWSMAKTLPMTINGGGAGALSVGGRTSFTPVGAMESMVFTGIKFNVPESVTANYEDGATLSPGETIS
ncbi:hypothetical protein, partial [Eubacterium aggregans]|uniref:hypothetical protein n=1 Tax=Eubacterium aggregans TaxID=81409 RepID=UPI003F3F4B1C